MARPWNKGLKIGKTHPQMGFQKGNKFHEDPRVKATQLKKGECLSPQTQFKKGIVSWNKGKIANQDCRGRLEAHHILNWLDFPELRYQVNNGITLCLAHHPRKRAEEKRLIPLFMGLVPESSELN